MSGDSTIDLNGHHLSAGLNDALFNVSGGKLTLTGNGTVTNTNWIARVTSGGEVIVEDGTYISQNEGFKAIGNGSRITMNGGTVQTVECALGANQGAAIELNGGLIETSDNMGIGTNGSSGQGGNMIVMNGGTIDASIKSAGYEAIGVYIANDDTFVMNDGEIIANGGTGLCMRGGDVTINGGEILASGKAKDGHTVEDGWIGDRKTVMEGVSAVIYHRAPGYSGMTDGMSLTVNGGSLTGDDHAIQVVSDEAEPQVFVTGGTFVPGWPETEPNEAPEEP